MRSDEASCRYLVVSGDIRRSRDLPDRAALQAQLEAALDRANARFAADMAVPLSVVQGDAFQGLLARPDRVIPLLVDLEIALRPATFRTGLGWGEVTTPVRPATASMDGPAFHRAAEALDTARRHDLWLVTRGLPPVAGEVVDGVAGLLGAVRFDWSEARWRAVDARRRHPTAKDAAAAAGVSPSAMSRALRSAHFTEVLAAEAALAALLRQACEVPA